MIESTKNYPKIRNFPEIVFLKNSTKSTFQAIFDLFYQAKACFDVSLRKNPFYKHFTMVLEPFPAKKNGIFYEVTHAAIHPHIYAN